MALSIETAPGNFASVSNEMLFVIYEATKANDESTYPDYRYVLDLYVDDVLVNRIKARPDPVYKKGVFNVGPMLQSFAQYGLKANYSNVYEDYTIKVNYKVKLGEEYGDTLYTNLVVDSNIREAYSSYQTRPFEETGILENVNQSFATNRPSITYGYKASKFELLPYFDNASGTTDVDVNYYAGINPVDIYSVTGAYTEKTIRQINVGFEKIATALGLTDSQKESVTHAYVKPTGPGKYIYYRCTRYTPMTLAWLNPYGAYDSYAFGLVNKLTEEIERKEFSRLPYTINASGEVSYQSNGVYNGGRKGFASTFKRSRRLTSELLTDAEYVWLAELFRSPEVYIFDDDADLFMPVIVSESNYEFRTFKNSKLTPLEFTVQYADVSNTQRL